MPSHPFFTAVDQDTRARRVYEFGVNTRAWLVEYRARHPHAPVDEARMQKRHDRAAREEMEEIDEFLRKFEPKGERVPEHMAQLAWG